MKELLVILGFGLLVVGAASGGGVSNDTPQQQMAMPQTKIVVIPDTGGNDWVVPVSVAVVTGVFGLGTALVVNRRRKR